MSSAASGPSGLVRMLKQGSIFQSAIDALKARGEGPVAWAIRDGLAGATIHGRLKAKARLGKAA